MIDTKLLLDRFPEAIVVLYSRDLRIIGCSDRWLNLMSETRGAMIGRTITEAFPPKEKNMGMLYEELLAKAAETAETQSVAELRYDVADPAGQMEERYWDVSVTPIVDDEGQIFLLQRVEDVTSRRSESTKLLKAIESGHLMALLIQNIRDYAVIMLDPNGIVRTWNKGAERIKGYTSAEAIGKHFSLFYTDEDLRQQIPRKGLEAAFSTGRFEMEGYRKRKDGTLFWADVIITKIVEEDGTHVGFAKITRDLTDRKASEDAVIRAFEDATRARAQFTASMSHEIRTPMNGVVSAARLIRQADMSEENRSLVRIILESSEGLLTIVNDILDYTKLDVTDFSLANKAFSLRSEVMYTINLARINAKDKTAAVISLRIDGQVPEYVYGDGLRFRQVLSNLLDNAVKFTRAGSIDVVVAPANDHPAAGGSAPVEVSVTDTGVGISEENQGRLFHPFTQVGEESRFKGTGLGLSICKRIVELMGGNIFVRSKAGGGSTFTFIVPFRVAASSEQPGPSHSTGDMPAQVRPNARLLVVDDSEINRKIVVRLLQRLGYLRVDTAENGRDALSRIESTLYDLVIMDIQMPVMDGFEATRQLRNRGSSVPVVALTADAQEGVPQQCADAGMDGYLVKPLDFEKVAQTLDRLLSSDRLIAT